jgi:hypothetical protein
MTRWLERRAAAVERHWFAPASTRDLGVVRALVFACLLFSLLDVLPTGVALSHADQTLFKPLPALKVMLLPLGWGARPSSGLILAIGWTAAAAALLAALGWFSRITTVVATLGTITIIAHNYSYREVNHSLALLVLIAAAISAAPSGMAFSLDAVRRRRRGLPPAPAMSPEARWPIRIGQWLFVIAYLSAASSKLVHGGIAWLNGETLAYYFMQDGIRFHSTVGLALVGWPRLAQLLSIGALGFELMFMVAVLKPRITWLYLAIGVVMHTTIYVVQRAPFFQWLVLYVVFIEALRQFGPLAIVTRPAAGVQPGRAGAVVPE